VGRQDLSVEADGSETFTVVSELVHRFWNGRIPNFDMMLVKLSGMSTKQILNLNTNTSLPVAAPNGTNITSVTLPFPEGIDLVSLGFNFLSNGTENEDSPLLQSGAVPFIDNDECETLEDPIQEISLNNAVTTQWLCTGASMIGICFGDAGTPIIIPGETPEEDLHVGVAAGYVCYILESTV
jgi:hypothetical protein